MIITELIFFFKQKTAYEIGTGDWSSDVCLPISFAKQHFTNNLGEAEASFVQKLGALVGLSGNSSEIGRASCRERV